ncbi:MAG: preprotein translocase subunit SecY [Chlamydiia bacterium]|nr:preprotein translocase subunit SecY [Chlamydiia bacterium]MCP5509292.1 preprotein translocase subunit SecY [Chlamydiales bacterium]
MIGTLRKIFSIPDLKQKILFTLMMLALCRLGRFIPVPGINAEEALKVFQSATGGGQNLFQLMDVFSGGAFAQMTIFALSVMPYISASIVMQLFMALAPGFQREIRENPDAGRKKMTKWTRLLTVGLAMFQSALVAKAVMGFNYANPGIIAAEISDTTLMGFPWLFYLIVIATMTTGTVFLMWIGEQISEKGIGNGISLIITIGILSSLPSTIGAIVRGLNLESQDAGQLTFATLVVLAAIFIFIIVGTILVTQAQRKIPLQYARRVVGRREVQGGGSAFIPLKLNYAGVMPVIFASAILMFPATLAQLAGQSGFLKSLVGWLSPGSWVYTLFYVGLILFFTYFWTATQFHPEQIASDMKKSGAFIPGVRQGRPTQNFLEFTMNRLTLAGALFLAFIAILPMLVSKILGVDPRISNFFGGTSLLILVGVVLDTLKQVESHLLMKRYDGYMKRGRKLARK